MTLSGELDLGTAPRLAERLRQLREEKRPVVVDLSGLEFMDSSGVYVLFDAIADARSGRWTLEVGDDLSPQVRRLFDLMGLERFLVIPAASPGAGLPPGAAHAPRDDTEALT